jgi:Co/Zn/Cd efflux system component
MSVIMEATPSDFRIEDLRKALVDDIDGVVGYHDLHVWQLVPESKLCLTVHLQREAS